MLFNSITRCNISRARSHFSCLHIRYLTNLDIVPGIPSGDWLGTRRLSTSTEKPRKRSTYRTRVLRTLRPERLSTVGQEVVDLSGRISATLHFLPKYIGPPLELHYTPKRASPPYYDPFPENTRGFLYYHHAPNMPKLSESVRFRICDSPELFDSGRDLLSPTGFAWGNTITQLVKNSTRLGFLLVLRDEELIDEELINDITKLGMSNRVGDRYLRSLSQPFIVDVAQEKTIITFITRAKLINCDFPRTLFFENRGHSKIFPLSGSIKVQFELSDLPEHTQFGPTLVIRVLDIIKPVTIVSPHEGSAIPVPVPGTLLHRITYGEKRVMYLPIQQQHMADDLLKFIKNSMT